MKQYRRIAALCAVFLMACSFSTVAFADGSPEPIPPEATPVPVPTAIPQTVAASNPLTPPGTGTVVDNATDADGKEFFTITTPEGNIFYLIIDRHREQKNVYFLDAVMEKDLLALAERAGVLEEIPLPAPAPIPASEPVIVVEQEKGGSSGFVVVVILVVLLGGGAGYYFKIYRPKQGRADAGEPYGEYMSDDYNAEDYGAEKDGFPDEDISPWDEYESKEEDEA